MIAAFQGGEGAAWRGARWGVRSLGLGTTIDFAGADSSRNDYFKKEREREKKTLRGEVCVPHVVESQPRVVGLRRHLNEGRAR